MTKTHKGSYFQNSSAFIIITCSLQFQIMYLPSFHKWGLEDLWSNFKICECLPEFSFWQRNFFRSLTIADATRPLGLKPGGFYWRHPMASCLTILYINIFLLRHFFHVQLFIYLCRKLHPELKSNLAEFKQHLIDSTSDLAPLKVWQLQGINRDFFKSFQVRDAAHSTKIFTSNQILEVFVCGGIFCQK